MNRRKMFMGMFLGLIIFTSGCLAPSAPKHDTLVIGTESFPPDLLPIHMWDNQGIIWNQIYGFLGMRAPGETTTIIPGIAEYWTYNTARTEYTFTLREGLTFHDGTAVTARDIEYSFKAGFFLNYFTDSISDPRFEDEYFNFSYTSPDALTLTISSNTGWLPDPMFEWDFSGIWGLYAIIPEDTLNTEEHWETFRRKPISIGPYRVISENGTENESVKLKRFDDWFGWGKTFTASNGQEYSFPKASNAFKYIEFREIIEPKVQLIEIRNSNIDLSMSGTFRASNASYQFLDNLPDFQVYLKEQLGGSVLGTNIQGNWPQIFNGTGNFPVTESWFRRVLSHGINRTKIIENAYDGVGLTRESFFPEWLKSKYPNLNTYGYYDFGYNKTKAEQLLDVAGYIPLGFTNEPDNRFGWGPYANETQIGGINQTKGRHFTLLTMDCGDCILRATTVKSELEQIGIYVDLLFPKFGDLWDLMFGTPGWEYNTDGPQPDPEYQGVIWDLCILGLTGIYDAPHSFVPYSSFLDWYFYGSAMNGWLNASNEIAIAKIWGGIPGGGFPWEFMDPPPDMPVGGYPIPVWTNDDSQYIDACSMKGEHLSSELPMIPLTTYYNVYVANSKIKNLFFATDGMFFVAYTYWD